MSHRLYLGNKMTEVPYFNAPWFDMAELELLKIPTVIQVFNPAEHDRNMGFNPMVCVRGSKEESEAAGFNLREALSADWEWIAKFSTGMVVGPDWMSSKGAKSEVGCHQALGLPVWEYQDFVLNWSDPAALTRLLVRPLRPVFAPVHVPVGPHEDPDDGGFFCDCHG
jgi:hypothetical protein